MPRTKKEQATQKTPPNFEQSLGELEAMVETMESGQLPLEDLISNYERGAKLIAHCETILNDARKRLELLTLTPTETGSTQKSDQDFSPASNDSSNHVDDEIRLF